MELIYCVLLLHRAGKSIDGSNIKKVLDAAGIEKSDSEIKGLLVAIQDLDIEKAIKESTMVPTVAPLAPAETLRKEEKKEETKEDVDKAAAGLSSLFG